MNDLSNHEIVNLLIEHEAAIASLYTAMSLGLPEMKDFWGRLIREEKAHAEVLRMLQRRLEAGGVFLNTRKFNEAAIRSSIDYIQRQVAKIATEGITKLRALALALNVEQAMLENELFRVFESDSADMKHEFQALRGHTVIHQKLLEQHLATAKNRVDQ